MKDRQGFWDRLAKQTDLEGELFPGQSLVEILGQHRVLVEQHRGVTEYSRERIGIRVSWGRIEVCGCCLELRRMNSEQLIISGQIYGVNLKKGC